MSFVASEYCKDDISEYSCSDEGYEYGEGAYECDDKSYKGYDGPYEHGNVSHEYDGESYEGYDGPCGNERYGGENHFSGDKYEMNGAYDDVEG